VRSCLRRQPAPVSVERKAAFVARRGRGLISAMRYPQGAVASCGFMAAAVGAVGNALGEVSAPGSWSGRRKWLYLPRPCRRT
jgi:hypothetical protein